MTGSTPSSPFSRNSPAPSRETTCWSRGASSITWRWRCRTSGWRKNSAATTRCARIRRPWRCSKRWWLPSPALASFPRCGSASRRPRRRSFRTTRWSWRRRYRSTGERGSTPALLRAPSPSRMSWTHRLPLPRIPTGTSISSTICRRVPISSTSKPPSAVIDRPCACLCGSTANRWPRLRCCPLRRRNSPWPMCRRRNASAIACCRALLASAARRCARR